MKSLSIAMSFLFTLVLSFFSAEASDFKQYDYNFFSDPKVMFKEQDAEIKKWNVVPNEISTAYCIKNRILVEQLASNALRKRNLIIEGSVSSICALFTMSIGVAGNNICSTLPSAIGSVDMATVNEKILIKDILDTYLDERCLK